MIITMTMEGLSRFIFCLLQTRMMSQKKLKVTSVTPGAMQVIYSSSLECLIQVGACVSCCLPSLAWGQRPMLSARFSLGPAPHTVCPLSAWGQHPMLSALFQLGASIPDRLPSFNLGPVYNILVSFLEDL